jgi:hypothetical protein
VSTFLQTWVVATETVPEIVATSSPVICSPERFVNKTPLHSLISEAAGFTLKQLPYTLNHEQQPHQQQFRPQITGADCKTRES